MSVAVILALVLAIADAPSPAETTPSMITNPDWRLKPNPTDPTLAFLRPKVWDGKPGSALLECRVNAVGTVGHCKVLNESPQGRGFGQWALDIAYLFKMRPKTVDGKPVSGGTVRVPVTFGVPKGSPTP